MILSGFNNGFNKGYPLVPESNCLESFMPDFFELVGTCKSFLDDDYKVYCDGDDSFTPSFANLIRFVGITSFLFNNFPCKGVVY